MIRPDDASAAQIRAADPLASTWLSANAGSGKTRVLTDRVARLLLGGTDPQHILCLTYTKAAASEMQNRLYARLGKWAMMPETQLRDELRALGEEGVIPPGMLRSARRLFARALETPGGLKIQTIHSFCASLLRRFPLESGVSPQFTEMDDRAAELLRAEIVDEMADGADAPLVEDVARYLTDENFGSFTAAVVKHREAFAAPLGLPGLLALFGQPADLDEDRIAAGVFLGGEADLIERFIAAMLEKGGNDAKDAAKLALCRNPGFDSLPSLETVMLYGAKAATPFGAKTGKLPTKPTRTLLADAMPDWDALMSRVEAAREPRLSLLAARKALALHRFATRFLAIYAERKLDHGWLDFDDLITRTRDLLSESSVASWVLYKIDGGISHILVDEAQDTSPAQWDVIRKLAHEFAAGAGVEPDRTRTIFVVGDKKQSIYSFQGADPRAFDAMQEEFRTRIEAARQRFQVAALAYSFRSSPAVLRIVDHCFRDRPGAGFDTDTGHIAYREPLPGRVDLWPVVQRQEDPEEGDWTDPVDRRGASHHAVILARRVADQIRRLVEEEHYIPDVGPDGYMRRRIRPGDFLILVQRRSEIFSEIIRACKNARLPIAGADRLKVGAELAVKDLAALLNFLALPEDSLSLATSLKSPLFGWDEQALFDLAHRRDKPHLWQALRERGADFPETLAMLRDLRAQVDFLRPYDLIERILTRHGGRRKLLSRLGREAEDGIDALLSQALAYERSTVPSLTGFLVWMETDDLEIKRQIDAATDQIRVMTVHGAKGLEAPIVILPDTIRKPPQIRSSIVEVGDRPVWRVGGDEAPEPMRDVLGAMRQAEENERLRLLYVALTRAEKWLIVAAAGELPGNGESWYQIVEKAMHEAGAEEILIEGEPGLRHAHGDWDAMPIRETARAEPADAPLEPLFGQPAPPAPVQVETLSPSDLGGAKALAGELGEESEAAKSHGRLVHEMLERLSARPSGDWPGFLSAMRPEADAGAFDAAAGEALAVLSHTDLRWIFDADAMCEVAITADLGSRRMHGTIDRLIVGHDRIVAVDFKTNRTVPQTAAQCPDGILRQMGAYAEGLRQIWPDRRIETGILWTRTGSFMSLPHEIVTQALRSVPYLDEAPGAS
ncbi:double-strand break repair helicase AddA [Sulfitobacter sp. LCG007]